jgi:hypothetical protein
MLVMVAAAGVDTPGTRIHLHLLCWLSLLIHAHNIASSRLCFASKLVRKGKYNVGVWRSSIDIC